MPDFLVIIKPAPVTTYTALPHGYRQETTMQPPSNRLKITAYSLTQAQKEIVQQFSSTPDTAIVSINQIQYTLQDLRNLVAPKYIIEQPDGVWALGNQH